MSNISSHAASMENPTASKGAGGTANGGRKGAPCFWPFPAGHTHTLLDAEGPGIVRHIWITVPPGNPLHMRNLILRAYWDGAEHPSVEAPLGDFFGVAHGRQRAFVNDFAYMQAGKGFNCWIPMPFKTRARITLENDCGEAVRMLFYQVDFTRGDCLDSDTGYFHARFRRANPCPLGRDFEILSTRGRGVYLATVLGVRSLYKGAWWGEGEMKFYIDGDRDLPSICGTGTEDYMGSAWGLDEIHTPFQGAPLVDNKNGFYSLYRLHKADPIYFQNDLRVTMQQIGYGNTEAARAHYGADFKRWHPAGGAPDTDSSYFERSDDWSCVAYWYQTPIAERRDELPGRDERSADLVTDAEEKIKRSDV
ncbi:MAG: DUF2961 domain-containing protein [Kiritimatiellaeota bacterium]|nr:DUF2961 domain-containing protein [Kiritimatiellota bacterium]